MGSAWGRDRVAPATDEGSRLRDAWMTWLPSDRWDSLNAGTLFCVPTLCFREASSQCVTFAPVLHLSAVEKDPLATQAQARHAVW